MKSINSIPRIGIGIASISLIAAYFVPLWRIMLWAPQYPEGLEMKIWIDTLSGDVKIISALNHYIGMKHIEVSMFPEFGYMKYILAGIITLGLLSSVWDKPGLRSAFFGTMISAAVAALIDFYLWGYDYGHNLNPEAAIKVEGMSYQPPLIGTKELLNFTAFSGPDIGGWIFIGSGLIVFAVLLFGLLYNRK